MGDFIQLINKMKISLKQFIFSYLKCLLWACAYTIVALIFPSMVGMIIDNGIALNDFSKVIKESMGLLVLGGLMILFQYLQKLSFASLSQEIIIDIKKTLIQKISRTNYLFWKQHKSGDVYTVIEKDVNQLENLLLSIFSNGITNVFVVLSVSIYMIYINMFIGVVVILLAFLFATFQRRIGNVAKRGMTKLRETVGNISIHTNNIVNNVLPIKMLGISKDIIDDYCRNLRDYKKQYIKQVLILNHVQSTGMAFTAIGLFIIMIFGAMEVLQNRLSIGFLFSLTMYLQRLYNPIIGLGNVYVSLQSFSPIVSKLLEILNNTNEIADGKYTPKTHLSGNILINNVKFKYSDGANYILDDFSLSIRSGEKIGIVGKNGTGKTSLLRLFARVCKAESGSILLDDVEISNYCEHFLEEEIGFMLQENYLPDWTLEDFFGKKNVENAEKMMNDLGIPLRKFSKGMNSRIGENKISLSGGELQKLAFIKLLLEQKQIYIFDEPTSALDLESEEKMITMLRKYLKNRTCIIITHRKAILNICDKIIEFK